MQGNGGQINSHDQDILVVSVITIIFISGLFWFFPPLFSYPANAMHLICGAPFAFVYLLLDKYSPDWLANIYHLWKSIDWSTGGSFIEQAKRASNPDWWPTYVFAIAIMFGFSHIKHRLLVKMKYVGVKHSPEFLIHSFGNRFPFLIPLRSIHPEWCDPTDINSPLRAADHPTDWAADRNLVPVCESCGDLVHERRDGGRVFWSCRTNYRKIGKNYCRKRYEDAPPSPGRFDAETCANHLLAQLLEHGRTNGKDIREVILNMKKEHVDKKFLWVMAVMLSMFCIKRRDDGYELLRLVCLSIDGKHDEKDKSKLTVRLRKKEWKQVEKKAMSLLDSLDDREVKALQEFVDIHAWNITLIMELFYNSSPLKKTWTHRKELIDGHSDAGKKIVPSAWFWWLKMFDRTLWYAINNVGRPSIWVECLMPAIQYGIEHERLERVDTPQVWYAVESLAEHLGYGGTPAEGVNTEYVGDLYYMREWASEAVM